MIYNLKMPTPILAWLYAYRYAVLFPLGVFEGPVAMLVSGLLVRIGFMEFWITYLLLMAGDLTGDVMWYYIGRHGLSRFIEKYGRWFSLDHKTVVRAEYFMKDHQGKILFLSKLTTGFGFAPALLAAAGAAKVPFKKYMLINFGGEFIWAGALMGVGYFFGNFYLAVDKSIRWAFILAMIVIGFAALYGFGKAAKRKFKDVA